MSEKLLKRKPIYGLLSKWPPYARNNCISSCVHKQDDREYHMLWSMSINATVSYFNVALSVV